MKKESEQGGCEERKTSHYTSKSWLDKTVCRIREARTDRILKKRLWTMKGRQEKDTKMGNNVVYALTKMSFGS